MSELPKVGDLVAIGDGGFRYVSLAMVTQVVGWDVWLRHVGRAWEDSLGWTVRPPGPSLECEPEPDYCLPAYQVRVIARRPRQLEKDNGTLIPFKMEVSAMITGTKMRAKVRVESVTKNAYAETLKLQAVYGGSTNAEDNTFSAATPNATIDMTITNKDLWGKFTPNEEFYVDFTPVPKPPAATPA